MAEAEQVLGCAGGATRADGAVTLEAAYCLGLCAIGPAALVDGEPVARVSRATLDALARTLPADAPAGAPSPSVPEDSGR